MSNARQEVPNKKNDFYANSYRSLMIILMVEIILVLVLVTVVLYQVFHRPLPFFSAIAANKQRMELTASYEPNLLPNTLLTWASKAAVAAYTFDFAHYDEQIRHARPYFTDAGWNGYLASTSQLIQSIIQKQLTVNGVVVGSPVISNQGMLPGRGYTWRIQIPFLVTYQISDKISRAN